jgi:hypothetical protein
MSIFSGELLLSVLLFIAAVAYAVESLKIPLMHRGAIGPGFLPLILALILAFCSVITFIRKVRLAQQKTSSPDREKSKKITRTFLAILIMVIYSQLFRILGFWIDTFFLSFFVAMLFRYGEEKLKKVIGFSLVSALIAIFLVYVLFGIVFRFTLPACKYL